MDSTAYTFTMFQAPEMPDELFDEPVRVAEARVRQHRGPVRVRIVRRRQPERRYVTNRVPAWLRWTSSSSSRSGFTPSVNSRRPPPASVGAITSRISSIRPAASSDCASEMPPVDPDVPAGPALQALDVIHDGLADQGRVRPALVGLGRRDHVLAHAVDEAGERLHLRRRPVPDPVVIRAAAKQDVVLRLDDPAEVVDHLRPPVGEPVSRLLGNAVERQQGVENDFS